MANADGRSPKRLRRQATSQRDGSRRKRTAMVELGAASKLNGALEFLEYLKSIGRASADAWLSAHFASIGTRSSIDLDSLSPRRGIRAAVNA
jgi:hypothetical protein